MQTKKWYQSKTMWLNIVAVIVSITGYLTPELLISIGFSNPTKFLTIIGTIVAIANVILRAGKVQPISTMPSGTFVSNPKP